MLECKNPKMNKNETIDLELNHPSLGWIPFTASKDDPEPHGREIYRRAMSGDYGEIKEAAE
jgi:hypothetical protein